MSADLVFVNGPVFTAMPVRPIARMVAITGGVIEAVGAEDLAGLVGSDTEVVDLRGRMLLPGFQDAHVHPVHGGLRRLRCDLAAADGAADALRTIGDRVSSTAEEWVLGGGWKYEWFDGGCPSAEALDTVTGGRPAYLQVADGHSGWANSVAFDLAGVDASTPDPPDGRIERLDDGRPQGTVHEGAMDLVERVVPPASPDMVERALLAGQEHLISLGITAWQDAWVSEEIHAAYRRLGAERRLRARVRGALVWDRFGDPSQIEGLEARRAEGVGRYRPHAVKLMLDGVCENFTAAMKAPYERGRGSGLHFIDPVDLGEIVIDLDRRGFQCHFHAIGDAAVASALDAVERARVENGWSDGRHHIAHIQVVDPGDVDRFRRLGVFANVQALWACNEPAMTELTVPFLGSERSRYQYPFGSLLRAGAGLAMGSDWPVSGAEVMAQVAVAVARLPVDSSTDQVFYPDERVPLGTALTGFTAGSAHVNHLESTTGTVEVGKAADMVVLSADPFEVDDIASVEVDMTVIDGSVVYAR